MSDNVNFIATGTTIIISTSIFSSGDVLIGTGSTTDTHAILTELPDTTILNSNKFD